MIKNFVFKKIFPPLFIYVILYYIINILSKKKNKCNCSLVQNRNILLNEIPSNLKNLSYAIYPDNEVYNIDRFIYNKLFNYFPHAIFYPENEEQISYLIKTIVGKKLKFAIRCGGHAYEPASLSEGYIIDVKKMSHIIIDKKNKIAKIGSGNILDRAVTMLAKENLIITTGEAKCVGISGYSLAGGKGILSRLYGVGCDNIRSARMINYKGELIKASSEENSDLLWALKGAGNGNFGVITEINFNVYENVYCQFVKLQWTWNPTHAKKIFDEYQKKIVIVSNFIFLQFIINYNNGSLSIMMNCFKFNNEPFIEIEVFKNLYDPIITMYEGTYTEVSQYWLTSPPENPFSKIKSNMIFEEISSKGVDIMIESFIRMKELNLSVNMIYTFDQIGGATQYGNSAYFPKTAIAVFTIFINWTSEEITYISKKFVNDVYEELITYTSKYAFPNMIDYDIIDYMEAYYGTNQDRLREIKKKYDPLNIFTSKQGIK